MSREAGQGFDVRRYLGAWLAAGLLAAAALYPVVCAERAGVDARRRIDALDAALGHDGWRPPIDPGTSLRVARLGPLLSSWESVGGCGAGSTGGAGFVKWIGRSTTGGLFQSITQFNYIHFTNGYNLVATEQLSRDIGDRWQVGVLVPYLYKWYDNPFFQEPPVDVSNAGIGDINLLGTFRFGPINATSLTLALGLPTGTHDATYKGSRLTQEKQLGLGPKATTFGTASLMLDHTIDETWGVIVVGGIAAWRGGRNELGNYRSPFASAYGYGGYFLGPFVPAVGLMLTGFLRPDEEARDPQDVPLVLLSPQVSLEWSSDYVALLAGVSLPIGLAGHTSPQTEMGPAFVRGPSVTGLQPWTIAFGVSVSPF